MRGGGRLDHGSGSIRWRARNDDRIPGSGTTAEEQEQGVAPTLSFDFRCRTDLDVDESGPASQIDEVKALESEVMDSLGIRSMERAVLPVEVGEHQATARAEEMTHRGQGGAGVVEMVEHEQRKREIKRLDRGRVGQEVELHSCDLGGAGGGQLLADDRKH